jgi:hypothetical protein
MSADNHFDEHEALAAFERRLKEYAERLRAGGGQLNLGEMGDLPEEERKLLLRLLAIGAGLGAGAVGLYFGKRIADGVARSGLPDALQHIEALPAEIVERIRAGWTGQSRRPQRIIIPEE